MVITLTTTETYDRGRKLAEQRLATDIEREMNLGFAWAWNNFLGAEDLDLRSALVAFAAERMASDLDLAKYPECRGMREVVEAQRSGFADVITDQAVAAFCQDWAMFISRRLNTRYVGTSPAPAQCTDFWFADNREGGPIHGSNRDDLPGHYTGLGFREKGIPRGPMKPWQPTKVTGIGGVSVGVLCDEEPECLFPVDMGLVIPDGVTDLREYIGYLEQYRDFWGPKNRLYTDAEFNFAAVEKANVRMGVRYSSGCCAITACAFLTPEMNAFKKERDLLSYQARGWDPEDNMDRAYWDGDEARYRRLLDLVQKEYDLGATMLGAAEIALDHAVPFPARVCIAGERGHRDEKEGMQNWTLVTNIWCLSGPNMRSYNWIIDPDHPKPAYRTECIINTGEDNAVRHAEWEAEVRTAGEIGLHLPI